MADFEGVLIKVIFLFNLILLCLGIFVAYQGVRSTSIITQGNETIDEVETLVSSLSMITKVLIITGVVISVVSFFGCCGALLESPPFLSWYIFFIVLLIAFQISVGFYVYQAKGIDKDIAQDMFFKAMRKYKADNKYKSFIDVTQSWLRCCGAKGASDWTSFMDTPPPSCCNDKKDPCPVSQSFTKNCATAISELQVDFRSQQVWYIGAVIGFQVILIIFTYYARKTMVERQNDSYY